MTLPNHPDNAKPSRLEEHVSVANLTSCSPQPQLQLPFSLHVTIAWISSITQPLLHLSCNSPQPLLPHLVSCNSPKPLLRLSYSSLQPLVSCINLLFVPDHFRNYVVVVPYYSGINLVVVPNHSCVHLLVVTNHFCNYAVVPYHYYNHL